MTEYDTALQASGQTGCRRLIKITTSPANSIYCSDVYCMIERQSYIDDLFDGRFLFVQPLQPEIHHSELNVVSASGLCANTSEVQTFACFGSAVIFVVAISRATSSYR
jgi:hypothetical protein